MSPQRPGASGRPSRTPARVTDGHSNPVAPIDYARVVELAGDPMFILDAEGRYIDANRAACELTGYTREEILRKRLGELTIPGEAADLDRHFAELRLNSRGQRLATVLRKDGTQLAVECRNVDLGNQTYLGIVREISDRLAVERDLQRTNNALTTLLELCTDAVISADEAMKITVWNPAAEAMFGYSADEAIGRSVRDLIPPEHRNQALGTWQKHLIEPRAEKFGRVIQAEAVREDGVRVPVELSVGVGLRGSSRIFTAVARDVTQQRQVVEQLNDALQQLRFYINRMPLAYVLWGKDFHVLEWNPAAEQIFGYTRDEAIGLDAWVLVPPEARPAVERVWADLLGGDTSSHSINDNVCKNGTRITCEWFNTPLRDSAGRIFSVASMAMDITERQLHETQVRNTQKLESLGVMAGGIAHDFNSSLMVILGNAALLRSLKTLPERAREHIELIEQAGSRASDLIKHLLAYARTGRHNPELTDLNSIIHDAMPYLRPSLGPVHEITLELAPELPRIVVDRSQVEQVLLNLCMNAREAMNGGTIQIRTQSLNLSAERLSRCIPHDARPGPFVELAVIDTGCGMSQAVLTRMFDPFFTTKPEGHGLGMAAVLGILRQHGAVVMVDSAEGVGTRVNVYFPVSTPVQTTKPPESKPSADASRRRRKR